MSIRDVIEGKKQWRAHVARVKALPSDYRVVYEEIQKYYFKVGPVGIEGGTLLPGLVEFFEQGAADGKSVRQLVGEDVAAFADELIADTPTYADRYRESLAGGAGAAEA